MSRWWRADAPTPPICWCGHEAEYHSINRFGVVVCVAPVNGTMSCPCGANGDEGYEPAEVPEGKEEK